MRPFWFDEFFTVDLARLPDLETHMRELRAGADLTPPLFHLATRAATKIAGTGRVGMRLPAIAGFWVMSVCLFLFVRKRYGAVCGIFAMLIPLLTGAEYYASEARGYGLMLGFCGLAILCWQRAQIGGVAIFLAAAIYCHLYAVFLVVPLAAGEAVRTIDRRKIDYAMWAALIAGAGSVALAAGAARNGAQTNQALVAPVTIWNIFDIYRSLLRGLAFPLAALASALLIYVRLRPASVAPSLAAPLLPRPELAMITTMVFAVPLVVVMASMAGHVNLVARYSLIMVAGVALAGGCAMGELRLRYGGVAALGALILAGFVAKLEFKRVSPYAFREENPVFQVPAAVPAGWPIYVQEAFLYAQLAHSVHGGSEPRFVADSQLAARFRIDSIADRNLLQLKGWTPLHIESYEDVRNGPRQVMLLYSSGRFGWLLQKLREDGGTAEVLAHQGDWLWMKVDRGERKAE